MKTPPHTEKKSRKELKKNPEPSLIRKIAEEKTPELLKKTGKGTCYPKMCAANTEGKCSALCRMKTRTFSAVSTQEAGKVPKAGQQAPLLAVELKDPARATSRRGDSTQ